MITLLEETESAEFYPQILEDLESDSDIQTEDVSAICCMVAPPQYALEVITAVIMGAWLVWLQPPMDSADRSSTGSVHKA